MLSVNQYISGGNILSHLKIRRPLVQFELCLSSGKKNFRGRRQLCDLNKPNLP